MVRVIHSINSGILILFKYFVKKSLAIILLLHDMRIYDKLLFLKDDALYFSNNLILQSLYHSKKRLIHPVG
jgi:hypothetical protein